MGVNFKSITTAAALKAPRRAEAGEPATRTVSAASPSTFDGSAPTALPTPPNVSRPDGRFAANTLKAVISLEGRAQMKRLVRIGAIGARGELPKGGSLKAVWGYLERAGLSRLTQHYAGPKTTPAEFAEHLNTSNRYEKYGLRRLDIHNPYKAPAGSLVVMAGHAPGTHGPEGEISIKGYGSKFYADGEAGYGGPGSFPKVNDCVLGVYAPI